MKADITAGLSVELTCTAGTVPLSQGIWGPERAGALSPGEILRGVARYRACGVLVGREVTVHLATIPPPCVLSCQQEGALHHHFSAVFCSNLNFLLSVCFGFSSPLYSFLRWKVSLLNSDLHFKMQIFIVINFPLAHFKSTPLVLVCCIFFVSHLITFPNIF